VQKLAVNLSAIAIAMVVPISDSHANQNSHERAVSNYIDSKVIYRVPSSTNVPQDSAKGIARNFQNQSVVDQAGNINYSRAAFAAAPPGGGSGSEEPGDSLLVNKEVLARIKVDESITPETTELLGEKIGLAVGSVSFSNTDVSIPGNNGLEVTVRRTFKGGNFAFGNRLDLANWSFDIPYIHTTLLSSYNKTTREIYYSGDWGNGRECSGSLFSDDFAGYQAYEYWNGDSINIPGAINEKLLFNSTGNLAERGTYPRVTQSNYKVSCAARDDGLGEKFIVHAPNGNKYTFDQLRLVMTSPLSKRKGQYNNRYQAFMLVSKVEDKFGNYVNYLYNDNGQLKSIDSNDNRSIELIYDDNDDFFVDRVVANGKTWQYNYETYNGHEKTLSEVIRPDGSKWQYDLGEFGFYSPKQTNYDQNQYDNCSSIDSNTTKVGTITHPNGAKGEFHIKGRVFGRSNVPRVVNHITQKDFARRCFTAASITKKKLTIPGSDKVLEWNYSYSDYNGQWLADKDAANARLRNFSLSNSPQITIDKLNHRKLSVVTPDGSRTDYYHNRDFSSFKDGKLILTDQFDVDGTTLLQRATSFYEEGRQYGDAQLQYENNQTHNVVSRLVKSTIEQYSGSEKTLYTTEYSNFGRYEKAKTTRQVYSHNNIAQRQKTSEQSYTHDVNKWILNLPSQSWLSSPSQAKTLVSETEYDLNGMPHIVYQFGKKIYTNQYNSDGTLRKKIFNVKMLGSESYRYIDYGTEYYRGYPTQITVPTSISSSLTKSISITANYDGQIASSTDFLGNTISYTYDSIGRLTKIDYASEAIEDTNFTYATLASNAGYAVLESDMFHQTVTRGQYQKDTYFDSLLRPVLVREEDTSDPDSVRYTYSEFNAYNKATFTSYPSNTVNISNGTFTEYDGLQRAIKTINSNASESLESTTEYLADNTIRNKSPKGAITITKFEAFGQPSFDKPLLIQNLLTGDADVETALSYNMFGSPLTVSQGEYTQYNAYDSQNRLCVTTRQDVGSKRFGYSDIGELMWQQQGEHITANLTCQTSTPSSDYTAFSYDNLGQTLSKTYYKTSNNDVENALSFTYDKSGNTVNVSQANGVENEYVYNSLGQLTAESLNYSGRTKTLGYKYNTMGYVDETTYPSKLVISHTVNALGQYQAISSPKTTYASAAKYYPSGQVKSFTYGNGYQFTQSLNDRLLPKNIESKLGNNSAIKFEYIYDDNSNVEKITDHVNSAYNIDLLYDDLDRMTYAKGKWGVGNIEYDVNGNILKYTLGSKSLTYAYGDNRLNSVSGYKNLDFTYDDVGNVKSRGNNTSYQYDLANQMIAAGDLSYVYDASGRRVSIRNNGVLTKLSMYNLAGKLIYQEDLSSGKVTEHLYLGSRYIASIDNTPSKPKASAPSKSSSASVALSWVGDANATKYIVEMQNGNGAWVQIYEGANLSAATANLANGAYNFRVKACNSAGCGSYSDTMTTTVLLPPSTPATISVPSSTDTDGSFNISWSASATATKYTLRELKDSGDWVTVSTDLRTLKALSGRANGSYKYAVNACNASGCSGYRYSSAFNVLLPPPVPSSISVPTGTDPDGAYTVSWPSVSTATKYQLSQKVNSGAWTIVSDGTNRSKAFSGKGNASYQYAVRACNASGCSAYKHSSTFSVLLPPAVPSSITVPTGNDADGAYTVSWPAVSTATKYQLAQKVNNGGWVTVSDNSNRSKAFSGKGNATYQYAVRACNASGCGGYRYSSSFKVLLPPPVPSSATVASYDHDGTYDVRWNASSTATHYMIAEKVNSGGYSIIHGNVKGTSYRKSGAQSKTYRYGVKACNSSGCSGYRYTGNMINTLAPSSITVPSISHSSSISIRWGSVANRTKYVLQERVGSGSWRTLLSSTTATSYTRTGRTNTTYQYRIAACNAGGCTGYKTSGSVRVVLPPSSISYPSKDHDGSFSVTWSSVSGATNYQVQQLFSGRWTSVYSGTARSASLSGRGNGNYYYRVRACYSSSCSGYKQGNKLWVIKPNLHLSLSKTYLNGGQNIEIDWSSTGADSCRIFGTNKPASGSMNYYARCSTTIEMSCKFGSQSISKSQSIIVKYSNCGGGGSPFDEF